MSRWSWFWAMPTRRSRWPICQYASRPARVHATSPKTAIRLDLDNALEKLALVHPRQARVVELRAFGGLTGDEAAEAMGVSRSTVESDWKFSKAWLTRALRQA